MGRDGHREVKIEDTTAPRNVEQNQSYVKREPSLDKDGRPTRDSAGSAAGPKHEDVGSGSDVSHGLGGNVNSQGIRQGGAGPNNGNLGNGGGGNFALTMDDYASLERVGNVDVDDFLGPIMDDNAIVGFGEEQQQWAHTSMPGGFGGAHDANLVAQASARASQATAELGKHREMVERAGLAAPDVATVRSSGPCRKRWVFSHRPARSPFCCVRPIQVP